MQARPERDKAKMLWQQSGGNRSLQSIADELSVPLPTVKAWRQRDQWTPDASTDQADASTSRDNASNATQTKQSCGMHEDASVASIDASSPSVPSSGPSRGERTYGESGGVRDDVISSQGQDAEAKSINAPANTPKNKGGRPLKYTPEQLNDLIDKYTLHCREKKRDMFGNPIKDSETGEYVFEQKQPYTIRGFAYFADTSCETLSEYADRPGFTEPIKKLHDLCYAYTESRLFVGGNPTGAIFSLKNNYGWTDRREIAQTNTNVLLVASPADAASLLSGMAGYFQAVERNVTPKPLEIEGEIDPIQ